MKYAVRYFSKFGHSEQMAKVVGEVVKTQPETVAVPLSEPVDILYLGAGVFLGKVNGAIGQFVDTLKPEQVKNVVCFGSCAIIDSPVPQMRKMLEAKGIRCDERSFTCKGSMGPVHSGHPDQKDLADLRAFIEQTIK